MKTNLTLTLAPEIAFDETNFHQHIKNYLQINDENSFTVRLLKRSIDARSRYIKVNIQADMKHHQIYCNLKMNIKMFLINVSVL